MAFSPKANTSSLKKNTQQRKPQFSWNQIKSLILSSSCIPCMPVLECGGYSKLTSSSTGDVIHNNVGLHGNGSYPDTKTTSSTSVSELGPEDLGRDAIKMIFKSSWLSKEDQFCKIERILKVHNTQTRIQRFEECRDLAQKLARNPRCAADGNEQLRFHCTSLTCSLSHSTTSLCDSVPGCGVCSILRHGFPGKTCYAKGLKGVHTTSTSVKAHNGYGGVDWHFTRAMLVCRVIAGRVKHITEEEKTNAAVAKNYDAIGAGCYESVVGKLEELFVFNPEAVLPCFVVIYTDHE